MRNISRNLFAQLEALFVMAVTITIGAFVIIVGGVLMLLAMMVDWVRHPPTTQTKEDPPDWFIFGVIAVVTSVVTIIAYLSSDYFAVATGIVVIVMTTACGVYEAFTHAIGALVADHGDDAYY